MIKPTSWEFAKAPPIPISKERIRKRSSFLNLLIEWKSRLPVD
jgi:hypothetical protein